MRCDKLFNVSNVYECGRNNPDVSCERAFMTTEDNEYFTDILDTLKNINIVTTKYCPIKISNNLFPASWMMKKKKSNVT